MARAALAGQRGLMAMPATIMTPTETRRITPRESNALLTYRLT
jgi:hypothetical protein